MKRPWHKRIGSTLPFKQTFEHEQLQTNVLTRTTTLTHACTMTKHTDISENVSSLAHENLRTDAFALPVK